MKINSNEQSDVGILLSSIDPAATITETELDRSRARALSFMAAESSHAAGTLPDNVSGGSRKPWRTWLGAGVLTGAVIIGGMALVPTPEDRFEDASRIIESLSRPQQEADKLPANTLSLAQLESLGINPSQTRLLGRSTTYTYYGAPAEETHAPGALPAPVGFNGGRICIIPIRADGEASVGCTLLKTFEGAGLKVESPDRSEAGWLVIPAGAKQARESVQNESGWTQQSPNFLVRNKH